MHVFKTTAVLSFYTHVWSDDGSAVKSCEKNLNSPMKTSTLKRNVIFFGFQLFVIILRDFKK